MAEKEFNVYEPIEIKYDMPYVKAKGLEWASTLAEAVQQKYDAFLATQLTLIAKVVRAKQKGNKIELEFMKKEKDYPCKKCKKECKSLHSCVRVLNWLLGK